ncbi:hypothetical protein CA13_49740 [Planctomycetes bacterium CA13]|uniref:AsmA-like C-terminal domain-containing protein n=1 Tax=Novipirellula herctigrandis TaxID=2527986 RepID=A0A5C5Z837_9BACT|nr:hypothetical protein CA13_49740 [Planctomycetes bacterium CA13]
MQFEVRNGRFYHEGLALLLPRGESSIRIVSKGSVGLDETLALQVTIDLPLNRLGDGPIANRLRTEGVTVDVGGTFEQPTIQLENNEGWLGELLGTFSNENDEDGEQSNEVLEQAVGDMIEGLMQRASEKASEREGSILQEPLIPRLRERFLRR